MNKNWKVVILHAFVERQKLTGIDRFSIDVGEDLHAPQSEVLYGTVSLFDGCIHIIHRKTCHCTYKPVRIFEDEFGQFVVADLAQFGCFFGESTFSGGGEPILRT